MFAQYRLTIPFFFTLVLSSASMAKDIDSPIGGCDSHGECFVVFDRSDAIAHAFCPEGTAIAAWRKNDRPILLQCQSSGTSEENRNYLLQNDKILGFNYGRYVKVSYIKQHPTEAIQDKFSKTPLCTAATENNLETAIFILLRKQPNQSSTDYCYELTYLSSLDGDFHIFNNHAAIEQSNREYFLPPIGRKIRRDIEILARQLRIWQTQRRLSDSPSN